MTRILKIRLIRSTLRSMSGEVSIFSSNLTNLKIFCPISNLSLDNHQGQLGIGSRSVGKTLMSPKAWSFNMIIRQISCGEEHAALVTCKNGIIHLSNDKSKGTDFYYRKQCRRSSRHWKSFLEAIFSAMPRRELRQSQMYSGFMWLGTYCRRNG